MKNLQIDPPSAFHEDKRRCEFSQPEQLQDEEYDPQDDGYDAQRTASTTALVKKVEAPTLMEDDFGTYSEYGDEFDDESHHYQEELLDEPRHYQDELLSLDDEPYRYHHDDRHQRQQHEEEVEETALALIESPSPSYETKSSWREEKQNLTSTSLVVSSPGAATTASSRPRERRARADLKKTLERYYSRSRDAQQTAAAAVMQ